MTESAKEKIIDIYAKAIQYKLTGYDFAEEILSLPSGLRAVRECNDHPHPNRQAFADLCACKGTGHISREIPVSEALGIPRMISDGSAIVSYAYGKPAIILPTGERLEVG